MYRYLLVFALVLPIFASAHVTVMPSEVGVGERQLFNVSVPTEKDMPTVGVRLVIPEGLQSVRPNVKPGWNVEIIKTGEGEGAVVREIVWTGGSIPADMRDDFFFRAQAPASVGSLVWKAYQTYADGSVVSWDMNEADLPEGEEEDSSSGPYSETEVINDLGGEAPAVAATPSDGEEGKDIRKVRGCWGLTTGASLIALVLSAYAVYAVWKRRVNDRPGTPPVV